MVAGRTLDLRGPDLARGPEVARRWSTFSVAGPQMWNDLPINVRSAQAIRKHVKACLLRRHFLD